MICKFCNSEFDDDLSVCPTCGKATNEEQVPVEGAEQEQVSAVEFVSQDNDLTIDEPTDVTNTVDGEPKADQTVNSVKTKKKSVTPLVLSIVAAVLALASLAVLLMIALGVDFKSFLPRANDILNKDSYCVSGEQAVKRGDTVVATIGDKKLTNSLLQIYYRMQVLDFLNYYGSYTAQLGLDMSLPLSEQTCYFEKDKTWEQYLLSVALDTWQNYQVIALLAEEEGFQLTEQDQQSLAELPQYLEEQAVESGYESVDALLKEVVGPSCSEELYIEYIRLEYVVRAYSITDVVVPTDEEVEAYFEENAERFAESGITKEMGNVASVRHILVCPKNETTDETTDDSTYSEEEWNACLKRAEDILNEWKMGDATEESFGKLATTYTEDTGSAANGGLYENIAPGDSYVENFLNWTIDMNRQVGDTDIVKTEYGYHIMYYVSGEPYWTKVVASQLQSERITEMTDAAEAKWPMKVNYRRIALSDLNFS